MNRLFLLFMETMVTATLLISVSCSPSETRQEGNVKTSSRTTMWLRDSGGGTHPDTLLVRYPAVDCTRVAAVMFVSDSGGGSHPDTILVDKVVFKHGRQK